MRTSIETYRSFLDGSSGMKDLLDDSNSVKGAWISANLGTKYRTQSQRHRKLLPVGRHVWKSDEGVSTTIWWCHR